MTKHLDHEKIAADLRAASPHWVEIDSSLTRSGVAGRAQRWNDPHRCPRAFVTMFWPDRERGFIFRTRRAWDGEPGNSAWRYVLEGRYLNSAIAPY